MKCPEHEILYIGREQFRGCQGLGRKWGKGRMIANGYGISFGGGENDLA